MSKKYWTIQQLTAPGTARAADVYIYGDIVSWAWTEYGEQSAHTFAEEIKALDVDIIRVHIDSCGGNINEAWGIYNTLREHPARIETYADGFVASAALYPYLAGDVRYTSSLAAFYLHNAWTSAEGYAEELRKAADEVEALTAVGIAAFTERAGMDAETVKQLMDAETWLTPDQAIEYGIATAKTEETATGATQSARAAIMQRVFNKPGAPAQQTEKPKEKPQQSNMHALSGFFNI